MLRKIKVEVDEKEPETKQYHIATSTTQEDVIYIWEEVGCEISGKWALMRQYNSKDALDCECSALAVLKLMLSPPTRRGVQGCVMPECGRAVQRAHGRVLGGPGRPVGERLNGGLRHRMSKITYATRRDAIEPAAATSLKPTGSRHCLPHNGRMHA